MKQKHIHTYIKYFDNDTYEYQTIMNTDEYIKFLNDKKLDTHLYNTTREDNITTYTRQNSLCTEIIKVW